jgi:hypothetical protein
VANVVAAMNVVTAAHAVGAPDAKVAATPPAGPHATVRNHAKTRRWMPHQALSHVQNAKTVHPVAKAAATAPGQSVVIAHHVLKRPSRPRPKPLPTPHPAPRHQRQTLNATAVAVVVVGAATAVKGAAMPPCLQKATTANKRCRSALKPTQRQPLKALSPQTANAQAAAVVAVGVTVVNVVNVHVKAPKQPPWPTAARVICSLPPPQVLPWPVPPAWPWLPCTTKPPTSSP